MSGKQPACSLGNELSKPRVVWASLETCQWPVLVGHYGNIIATAVTLAAFQPETTQSSPSTSAKRQLGTFTCHQEALQSVFGMLALAIVDQCQCARPTSRKF